MLLLFTDIGLTKKAVGLGQTPTLCMEYIHTRVYVFLLIVHLPEISCFTRFSFMRVYVCVCEQYQYREGKGRCLLFLFIYLLAAQECSDCCITIAHSQTV